MKLRSFWIAFAAVSYVGTAGAAPIVRSANLSLSFEVHHFTSAPFTVSVAGNVNVDEMAGTLTVPAMAILDSTVPATAPIVNPPAFLTAGFWRATKIGVAGGTFAVGGATSQAVPSEGPCPEPGLFGCVNGGGLGGKLEVTGGFDWVFTNTPVTLPIDFGNHQVGLTGAGGFFTSDAGPFTTGTAIAGLATTTFSPPQTRFGTVNPGLSQMSLVAPTHIIILGSSSILFTRLTIEFTDGQGLPSFVPEPVPGVLMLAGILGLAALRRR